MTAIKRVGLAIAGLLNPREALIFDDAVFDLIDQPTAVYADPRGAQTVGATKVTARDRVLTAARVRYNATTLLYEVQRQYNVASVEVVGNAARVHFATPFADTLYAPFVSVVRGDTPANIAIPYDVDPHTAYCDVYFIDETNTPVASSFSFRADLPS